MRNFLRARLVAQDKASGMRRLDLHTLVQKDSSMSLSTMRLLVEAINVPEAEKWVDTAMNTAYAGELCIDVFRGMSMSKCPAETHARHQAV